MIIRDFACCYYFFGLWDARLTEGREDRRPLPEGKHLSF